jgi:hypothetical protein
MRDLRHASTAEGRTAAVRALALVAMSIAAVVVAGIALVVVAAGCGSSPQAATSASPSSAPTSSSPAATSTPSGTPTATTQPAGAPVPAGFRAASITFVSASECFVLGTAPSTGTALLRSLDRGQTWVRLKAPVAPLAAPTGSSSVATAWGTRFASPSHGFIFGRKLWETTDGGGHWTLDSAPTDPILSLATIDGQVLALTVKDTSQGDSGPATLLRRPLAGGSWHTIASVKTVDLTDPTDLIATQAGTAAVLDGAHVLTTKDGGLTMVSRATPALPKYYIPSSVTATSANGLALLCVGQGSTGHTQKLVYVSSDGGAYWSKAGAPSALGDGGTLAGSGTTLVLATASAASWLDRSADGGHAWTTAVVYGDGGVGWGDLGFTTPSDAVVVHGPAGRGGGGRPGQLLLSSNGGATWQAVTF